MLHTDMDSRIKLPRIIQGGMGIGVSGWKLARAVSKYGQLGVVSGVGIDSLLARRLQNGDQDGTLRRAMEAFPYKDVVKRVLKRYLNNGEHQTSSPYRLVPRPSLDCDPLRSELTVLANFVEVTLAKEGHDGLIGINYMEKLQMTTPAAVYGAMLAKVDYILMGAGIPSEIPQLIEDFSKGKVGKITVQIAGGEHDQKTGEMHTDASSGETASPGSRAQKESHEARVYLDPQLSFHDTPQLAKPVFLAIISSSSLANFLFRNPATRPDGFIIESHTAGGHSARPRGKMNLDESGQPIYGQRDEVDLAQLLELKLPFWLAGAKANHQSLQEAISQGAAGIQVGSAFALSQESEILPQIKEDIIESYLSDAMAIHADPEASPTGFPIKIARLKNTLSDIGIYKRRDRICDVGYLRTPFLDRKGKIRYRCPAEPIEDYIQKGGDPKEVKNKVCLCNGLMATIGLGQSRKDGYSEPPVVTIGQDLSFLKDLVSRFGKKYYAKDVIDYLLQIGKDCLSEAENKISNRSNLLGITGKTIHKDSDADHIKYTIIGA